MAKKGKNGGRHIVVFDVGKTNKKLVVFDSSLRPVHSVFEVFDEVQQDGISYETVEETSLWLLDNLKEIAARFEVGALSVSAHGAAFACVDADGCLAMPVLSYTTDPGEAFHNEFYSRFGDPDKLHMETATPNMPGLGCMAKGIYFASQRFPEEFAKTTTILGLPQFYGHLLTGNRGAEYTFMATHTYLWDFDRCDYGPLVDAMGIRKLMPPKIQRPWDVLGTVAPEISKRTGIPETAVVTLGIHDSNASMLPYLVKVSKPFVINSTGTVCVAMRPASGVTFSPDEMGKVVYYNHNAFANPVRTVIFLGGLEFDIYTGQFASRHGEKAFPEFDKNLCENILRRREEFILPSIVPFGVFPGSQARLIESGKALSFGELMAGTAPQFFDDFDRAYCALNLSLAIQSKCAIEMTGIELGDEIYIEGGFRKNAVYTALLASMFPGSPVKLSGLEEATAFGGALLGKSALEGKSPMELGDAFSIEQQTVAGHGLDGLDGYIDEFMRLVGE